MRSTCDWDADRRANGWTDRPWHDRFIAALSEGATVLDLGCGAGSPIALNMVESGLHTTGVDASRTLISLCRDRMPDQEWIVGDMRSLSLNRKFGGKDYATDVLSFPPEDIAISFDRAAAQAAEMQHSVEDEVRILMLHGLLHLAGMDHHTDKGAMARAEARWRKPASFLYPQLNASL